MRNTGYGDGGNAMSTMSNSVRRLLEEGANPQRRVWGLVRDEWPRFFEHKCKEDHN